MSDRGKKAYIPWHERIDEALIKAITKQFVADAFSKGFRVTSVEVTWSEGGKFNVSTKGKPLTRIKPDTGENLH